MKKHILIIDDETAILRLLDFLLSKEYSITLRCNGYEAMQWLEEGNKPDLIILDIQMPYFDGPEFFNSIKVSGLFSDIPVIILTGESDTNHIQSSFKHPLENIIQKPFNPEKLKYAIKSILRRTEQSDQVET
ncbi:MAG: two-component system response regulator [Sphingobacteriales bacterium 41-5]|nr:MAG: two-component system response regulator [Sphingobacteriales bacterium 41-5]